ncbi:MAG: hypothetical protein COT90_02120 [Candidatus Diapherotrites archaeon CG10_big_fil_rev_8_21_14_0_10_31_34]|nr:MAG: hypothetical protein COT90_02120 [Candidatus Diapherotrites archaeon CG10_big_fil_rev_8_21_14_0_10_31_34]
MIDSIIFDIDGIIIDVSKSYREAIRQTSKEFLGKTVSQEEVSAIKKIPEFNNDWDATFELVCLLEKNVSTGEFRKKVCKVTEKDRKRKKYIELFKVFQAKYLGEKLYKTIYGKKPVSKEKGLINNEKLMIPKKVFMELKKEFKLGIVTGRPRKEAEYSLKLNGLDAFFDFKKIVCREDTKKSKPDAKPLFLAAKNIGSKKAVYVGDSINDVLAAEKAKMKSIYLGKENLGDYSIKKIEDLMEGIKWLKSEKQ